MFNKCDKNDDSYYLNIGVLEGEIILYDIQFIFLSIIFESTQEQKGQNMHIKLWKLKLMIFST
mgnify:CR=1 FL=1